jgi:hypothetical protein
MQPHCSDVSLQSPAELPVLAPMIEREILFRLLLDDKSVALHRIAQANSQPRRIGIAIVWSKKHFREAFLIDELARRVGISTSSFHQWFLRHQEPESAAVASRASGAV